MDAQVIDRNDPFPSIAKIVVGLFFAAVGVILTGENLDVFHVGDFLLYWPAVIVLIGILKMFDPGSRMVAIILVVVGMWFLANNAGWIDLSVFDLWPLLLIGAGVGLVAHSMGMGPRSIKLPTNLAVLGEKKVVESSTYRGGRIAAVLGGYFLDLTNADITDGPAVIETLAVCGGIEITVPDNWEVIGQVTPIMAGFELKSTGPWDSRKQLVVKGLALMGGIEVKRRKS